MRAYKYRLGSRYGEDVEDHEGVVDGGGEHDKQMPDLVEAEAPRHGIGLLDREDDRAGGLE
jgi:hypothetical protein